jgi:NADPH-dependent curcumin reductase CurA
MGARGFTLACQGGSCSLLMRGCINIEFVDSTTTPSFGSVDICYREDIIDSLEKAPEDFIRMMASRNFGEVFVRLS